MLTLKQRDALQNAETAWEFVSRPELDDMIRNPKHYRSQPEEIRWFCQSEPQRSF